MHVKVEAHRPGIQAWWFKPFLGEDDFYEDDEPVGRCPCQVQRGADTHDFGYVQPATRKPGWIPAGAFTCGLVPRTCSQNTSAELFGRVELGRVQRSAHFADFNPPATTRLGSLGPRIRVASVDACRLKMRGRRHLPGDTSHQVEWLSKEHRCANCRARNRSSRRPTSTVYDKATVGATDGSMDVDRAEGLWSLHSWQETGSISRSVSVMKGRHFLWGQCRSSTGRSSEGELQEHWDEERDSVLGAEVIVRPARFHIDTLEGSMAAPSGDQIIRVWPVRACKPGHLCREL